MEFEFKDCMCEATCEELVQMARDRTVSLMYIFLLPEGMTFLEPTIRRCLEANDALRVVVKRFPFETIQSSSSASRSRASGQWHHLSSAICAPRRPRALTTAPRMTLRLYTSPSR